MARSVRWSEPALEDLHQAASYIARDSPHYAQALIDRAAATARTLPDFPEAARRVPEIDDPNVRERFVQSYRLIYEIGPDAIDVLAFIHGARDLALWLQREER